MTEDPYARIRTTLDAERSPSDKALRGLVRDFRGPRKSCARGKSRAGERLYKAIRATGDRALERDFLLSFNASDTGSFLRISADKARHAASFKTFLSMRTRMLKSQGRASCPEWMIWTKQDAPTFARLAGFPAPGIQGPFPMADLALADETVVKPLDPRWTEGVYVLARNDRIYDMRKCEWLPSREVLTKRMRADLARGRNRRDQWLVEEFIANPDAPGGLARDIRFFVFYGEIGLSGIIERYPRINEIWLDQDGQVADRGIPSKGEPPADTHIPESLVQAVRDLSLQIPAPFVRIDLLQGKDRHTIGEFTARPGNFYRYGRKLDLKLGDMALAAQARLQRDLLAGKDFAAYRRFTEDAGTP